MDGSFSYGLSKFVVRNVFAFATKPCSEVILLIFFLKRYATERLSCDDISTSPINTIMSSADCVERSVLGLNTLYCAPFSIMLMCTI